MRTRPLRRGSITAFSATLQVTTRAVLEDGLELAREVTSGGALGQPLIDGDWLPRLGHLLPSRLFLPNGAR